MVIIYWIACKKNNRISLYLGTRDNIHWTIENCPIYRPSDISNGNISPLHHLPPQQSILNAQPSPNLKWLTTTLRLMPSSIPILQLQTSFILVLLFQWWTSVPPPATVVNHIPCPGPDIHWLIWSTINWLLTDLQLEAFSPLWLNSPHSEILSHSGMANPPQNALQWR